MIIKVKLLSIKQLVNSSNKTSACIGCYLWYQILKGIAQMKESANVLLLKILNSLYFEKI